jgi:hypothetical protein
MAFVYTVLDWGREVWVKELSERQHVVLPKEVAVSVPVTTANVEVAVEHAPITGDVLDMEEGALFAACDDLIATTIVTKEISAVASSLGLQGVEEMMGGQAVIGENEPSLIKRGRKPGQLGFASDINVMRFGVYGHRMVACFDDMSINMQKKGWFDKAFAWICDSNAGMPGEFDGDGLESVLLEAAKTKKRVVPFVSRRV